jgi:stage V sporulation protein R
MVTQQEIEEMKVEISGYARDYGLDCYEVIFELCDYDQISEIAARGGFPTRYPHWRWGMEYDSLKKGYEYGLQKIYEMVINSDPCYAYLMHCNQLIDQKLVIAHVYGHCDFFKNNQWFSHTNRKMMDEVANHGTRIRRYYEKYGRERVEDFIDCCLSLEQLIDIHSTWKAKDKPAIDVPDFEKFEAKEYMEKYINPDDYVKAQMKQVEEKRNQMRKFPAESESDVLAFLMEYAPLEMWQRDVISIVREEAYYFLPQWQTKIMNEGWATFWHSIIMTQKAMKDSELIDFADHHSGTVFQAPGRLNPYKLGLELFRDIEERWNKGKFGREYEECQDYAKRKAWNTNAGLGREKIFEVRRAHNDLTFIDEFMTEEFSVENGFYTYKLNPKTGYYEIDSRDFQKVKAQMLNQLTNMGNPFIVVEDGNFENRGELLLRHKFEGTELHLEFAEATMRNVCAIWGRPVNLLTVVNGQEKVFHHDGQKFSEKVAPAEK